ncbi:hypothetical protein AA700_0325 [Acidiphilium acidophilum DSM 700]|nr:hypothetical protein AA700_0325 [Acidiphilium acidophilum DSM 700]
MTLSDEFPAQDREIIDLTVKRNEHGVVLIAHRLMTCSKIEERQATKSHTDRGFNVKPFIVWPPMSDRVCHAPEQPGIDRNSPRSCRSQWKQPGETTHALKSPGIYPPLIMITQLRTA